MPKTPTPQVDEPFDLSIRDLAQRYNVTERAVRQWREDRTGPTGIKVGREVRFRRSDVIAWEQARIQPGADAPPRRLTPTAP